MEQFCVKYCSDLETQKDRYSHIISAIAKDTELSKSLKTLEFSHNKLGSQQDAKQAMVDKKLDNIELIFTENSQKAVQPMIHLKGISHSGSSTESQHGESSNYGSD